MRLVLGAGGSTGYSALVTGPTDMAKSGLSDGAVRLPAWLFANRPAHTAPARNTLPPAPQRRPRQMAAATDQDRRVGYG